jgi:hypothetical protein
MFTVARQSQQQSRFAEVAQLVEQTIRNRQVAGSIPALGSTVFCNSHEINQLTFGL